MARVVPKSKENWGNDDGGCGSRRKCANSEYKRKCEITAEVIRFVQINDFVFLLLRCGVCVCVSNRGTKKKEEGTGDGAYGSLTNALGARRLSSLAHGKTNSKNKQIIEGLLVWRRSTENPAKRKWKKYEYEERRPPMMSCFFSRHSYSLLFCCLCI